MENLQNYLQLSDVVSEKVSVLHNHTYVRMYMPCTVCMYMLLQQTTKISNVC